MPSRRSAGHIFRSGRTSVRASEGMLGLAIAGSAIAVGAVHTVTLCVTCSVLACAAAISWYGAEPIRVRPVATILLLVAIVLTGFTALQCLPMPSSLLAHLEPSTADVWSRSLAPLREPGPRWSPLSLDPTATRIEVLKGTTYALAFIVALRTTRTRAGVAFVSGVIVVTGLMLALAAIVHPAFGAKRLFGVYEPGPGIAGRHLAPLLNPNHLGGYLNLSLCLALASALSPTPRLPRSLSSAAAVFLVSVQVWQASRAGVATMALGVVLVFALARSAHLQRNGGLSWSTFASSIATVVAAAMVGLGISEGTSEELLDADVSKVALAFRALRVAVAHPIFGIGRGAFESVFPRFREGAGHVTYTHPEDIVAQWATEWGLPVSVCAFAAIAFALRPKSALARSTSAAGAWAGLAALAVQNIGDFSSEVPGVMLGAVGCAAIVVGGSAGEVPRYRLERWSGSPRGVAVISIAAGLLACALVLPGVGHELYQERRALYDASRASAIPSDDFNRLTRACMLRHPSEPYFPFIAAVRAIQARDVSAMPWLAATLERAIVYGPAHLLLARLLSTRSLAQGRLEYRLAVEQQPELFEIVAREVPHLVTGFDDAMELVPRGRAAAPMLVILAEGVGSRLPATRVRLSHELVAREPTKAEGWAWLANDAVTDLTTGDAAPWCLGDGRSRCVRAALSSVARLEELEPGACGPLVYKAFALAESGSPQVAMDGLERATESVKDPSICLEGLVQVAELVHDPARAELALQKIVRLPCQEEGACVMALMFAAARFERMGSLRQALVASERAHDRAPDNEDILVLVARLAASNGEHARARIYYEDLARRHPEDARWRHGSETERNAAMGSVVPM